MLSVNCMAIVLLDLDLSLGFFGLIVSLGERTGGFKNMILYLDHSLYRP